MLSRPQPARSFCSGTLSAAFKPFHLWVRPVSIQITKITSPWQSLLWKFFLSGKSFRRETKNYGHEREKPWNWAWPLEERNAENPGCHTDLTPKALAVLLQPGGLGLSLNFTSSSWLCFPRNHNTLRNAFPKCELGDWQRGWLIWYPKRQAGMIR